MVRIKKEKKRDWELVILLARIPRLRERAAVLWGGRKSPGIDSPFISHKRGRGARQRVNGRPTYLPFALCPSTAMSLAKVTLVTTTSTRRTRGRESGASGQAIVIAEGASEGGRLSTGIASERGCCLLLDGTWKPRDSSRSINHNNTSQAARPGTRDGPNALAGFEGREHRRQRDHDDGQSRAVCRRDTLVGVGSPGEGGGKQDDTFIWPRGAKDPRHQVLVAPPASRNHVCVGVQAPLVP